MQGFLGTYGHRCDSLLIWRSACSQLDSGSDLFGSTRGPGGHTSEYKTVLRHDGCFVLFVSGHRF